MDGAPWETRDVGATFRADVRCVERSTGCQLIRVNPSFALLVGPSSVTVRTEVDDERGPGSSSVVGRIEPFVVLTTCAGSDDIETR